MEMKDSHFCDWTYDDKWKIGELRRKEIVVVRFWKLRQRKNKQKGENKKWEWGQEKSIS